jgi:uncharacterized membrane protein
MDISALFSVLMRFFHIGSAVGLVGGVLYAKLAATPAINLLPEAERAIAAQTVQRKFRGILFALILLIVVSGLYNGFGPGAPHHTSAWQMWFGIKMLFALHFLTAGVLWAASPYGDAAVEGKGKRRLLSLAISGFIIILIGNYLRYLSLHNL